MMRLAEFIPVNLHWLLTGRGPKVFKEAEEKNEEPFQIMKDALPAEGRILVPGIKGADSVYQLKSTWMEPRIMEDDYIFVDWNPTSVGDLIAFRHQSDRVMVGWLREFGKERKQRIEAEKPQNGSIAASECKIIGRVVCSVRATYYR